MKKLFHSIATTHMVMTKILATVSIKAPTIRHIKLCIRCSLCTTVHTYRAGDHVLLPAK